MSADRQLQIDDIDIELIDGEEHSGLTVKLEEFEGPLDLLLHLIKTHKIDIRSIFIYPITEQYIEYIQQFSTYELEKAAEFIEMAAYLIEIKSKSLLPKAEIDRETPAQDDPAGELVRRLEEYKLFKEASAVLKELEAVGGYPRQPDDSVGCIRTVLSSMTVKSMMDSLHRLFERQQKRAMTIEAQTIKKDRFTVTEKAESIKEQLQRCKTCRFTDFFEEDYTRGEIITTFLSVLELLKDAFIVAAQNELFGEITLSIREPEPEGESQIIEDGKEE